LFYGVGIFYEGDSHCDVTLIVSDAYPEE